MAQPMQQPVVLDARPPRDRIRMAMLVTIGVGVVAIVGGLLGGISGAGSVAVLVVGGLFVLVGLSIASSYRRMMRPHTLYFEPAGIRWDDPQGVSWAVAWQELAGVAVANEAMYQVSGKASRDYFEPRASVTMLLEPADPGFAARHPEMAHLQGLDGGTGYGLPLGPAPERITVIEQGVRTFRPDLYRGIRTPRQ